MLKSTLGWVFLCLPREFANGRCGDDYRRWRGKQIEKEVMFTRVTDREVSYIAIDHPFAGAVPQWKFLDQFQPMPQKKRR
jgi:hypothetical protein